jgi:ERF superfamily
MDSSMTNQSTPERANIVQHNQLPAELSQQHHELRPAELPPPPASTPGKITGAIVGVMAEVGTVAKRGHNNFHNYNFAQMQDVLQELTPLMAKHGLAILQTEVERGFDDQGKAIAIKYAFTLAHSSGEVWPERIYQTGSANCRTSKGSWDDKAIAKAHTGARKQVLLALFQVPTGDVEDGDADGSEPEPRRSEALVSQELYDTLRQELQTLEDGDVSLDGLSTWSKDNKDRFAQLTDVHYASLTNHYRNTKARTQSKWKAARAAAMSNNAQGGVSSTEGPTTEVLTPDETADMLRS